MSAAEQDLIEREKELGRLVSIEDEVARDRGHNPIWSYGEDADGLTATSRCEGCGERMALRVWPDGRAWSAGRLRVTRECVSKEVVA